MTILDKGRLWIASRETNVDYERYPAIMQHGLARVRQTAQKRQRTTTYTSNFHSFGNNFLQEARVHEQRTVSG